MVLADGLGERGPRDLAGRLSTSGRMLLSYFGTQDALVVAVLKLSQVLEMGSRCRG